MCVKLNTYYLLYNILCINICLYLLYMCIKYEIGV